MCGGCAYVEARRPVSVNAPRGTPQPTSEINGSGSTGGSHTGLEPLFYGPEELKEKLNEALTAIGVEYSFAYGHNDQRLPNPRLRLHGHGHIGLPLAEADAKVIISKCRQSPFGKGSQTFVDDSARRCWELNLDQFSLDNPDWRVTVQNILPEVHSRLALGCGLQGIRAELYKLLIYEEGAFFKPHQDTEKIPGMFGTLMIALPSPHQGGELVLQHQDETQWLGTAIGSDSHYSCAAWYSDVFHELRPVTKGYRLVLTYNLAMSKSSGPIAMPSVALRSQESRVQDLLRQWDTELISYDRPTYTNRLPAYLAYKLEHQYTEANLTLDRLTAQDRMRAECLQRAAQVTDDGDDDEYEAYLRAFEERDEEDEDEDEENEDDGIPVDSRFGSSGEELDRETRIRGIVALDGTKIIDELDYVEENLVGGNPWDEDNPDDEEHSGFTGNEGCTATYWYRESAVIIVPQNKIYKLMFRGTHRWQNAQKWLRDLKADIYNDQHASHRLEQLCNMLLRSAKSGISFDPSHLFNSGPDIEDKSACLREIAQIGLEIGLLELFDAAWLELEGHVDCFYQLGRCLSSRDVRRIESSILRTMAKKRGIAARYEAYKIIISGFEDASTTLSAQAREECQLWLHRDLIGFVVSDTKNLCKADGAALAEIWSNADEYSRTSLKESLFAAPTTIQVGFCLRLASEAGQTDSPDSERADMLRSCLLQIWTTFALDTAKIIPTLNATPLNVERSVMTAADLIELLRLTDVHRIEESKEGGSPTDAVSHTLLYKCGDAQKDDLIYTALPFAHHIVRNKIPRFAVGGDTRNIHGCAIIKTIVQRYAATYVGLKPVETRNHAVNIQTHCTCADCYGVIPLLRSPTQTVGHFRMGKERRQHLHRIFTDRGKPHYDVETLRGSNSNVWQITKATHSAHLKEEKAWKARTNELWKNLETLDKAGPLQSFLGPELYQAVKLKKLDVLIGNQCPVDQKIPLGEATAASTNKRLWNEDTLASNASHPSKRVARDSALPAQVVDLTNE